MCRVCGYIHLLWLCDCVCIITFIVFISFPYSSSLLLSYIVTSVSSSWHGTWHVSGSLSLWAFKGLTHPHVRSQQDLWQSHTQVFYLQLWPAGTDCVYFSRSSMFSKELKLHYSPSITPGGKWSSPSVWQPALCPVCRKLYFAFCGSTYQSSRTLPVKLWFRSDQ